MAATPHHAVLYYALHHAIVWLLPVEDTGLIHPNRPTGPPALLAAVETVFNLSVTTTTTRTSVV